MHTFIGYIVDRMDIKWPLNSFNFDESVLLYLVIMFSECNKTGCRLIFTENFN